VPGPGECPWSFGFGFLLLGLNGAFLLSYGAVTAVISSMSFFFSKFYLLQIQTMFTVMTEAIYLRMRLISPLLLPVIDILYQ
jgi:hypothetical protein